MVPSWQRTAALVVVAVWAIVALARLTRLVEPAEVPIGEEVASFVAFAAQTIPADGGYLYVQPTEFGSDSGVAPRLRYELHPRRYEDIRASEDEAAARQVMARNRLRYVVVPQAHLLPPSHWARQAPGWSRTDLSGDAYVLVAP
jgi:hypothetical protein